MQVHAPAFVDAISKWPTWRSLAWQREPLAKWKLTAVQVGFNSSDKK